jgi:hypothetical protein
MTNVRTVSNIRRFKELSIGAKFRFVSLPHSVTENDETLWVKTSARTYVFADKKREKAVLARAKEIAKIYKYKSPKSLPANRVGSINAMVIPVSSYPKVKYVKMGGK